MKLSRRGILGGLFAISVPVVAEAKPTPTKQHFIKGMIVPRYHMVPACHEGHIFAGGHATAQMVVCDYDIFDGGKFVPFNSAAGQQVLRDLS